MSEPSAPVCELASETCAGPITLVGELLAHACEQHRGLVIRAAFLRQVPIQR